MQVRRGHQGVAGGIRALQGTLHLLTFGIARADRGKRYALARWLCLGSLRQAFASPLKMAI